MLAGHGDGVDGRGWGGIPGIGRPVPRLPSEQAELLVHLVLADVAFVCLTG